MQEDDQAHERDDGDEGAQCEHAGEHDALSEGRVEAPNVRDGHYDDEEVEDYVGDGAAEVDVACFDAGFLRDSYVPGGSYGQAVENYAEHL